MGRNIGLALATIILFLVTTTWADTVAIPRTGQTTCCDSAGNALGSCANTGQDGDIQAGVAWPNPRFSVQGECVVDNLTGLMWAKDASLNGISSWMDAIDSANSLSLCGYTDWRLPNINEMESLYNPGQEDVAAWLMDQGFLNVQGYDQWYWSSTTRAVYPDWAWLTSLYGDDLSVDEKATDYFKWPVRGDTTWPARLWQTGQKETFWVGDDGNLGKGVSWSAVRFTDQGNGTVMDNLTGLMWTKDANGPGPSACNGGSQMNWQGALDYVACLNTHSYLGYADWHLPNLKELISLVDRSQYDPALPVGHPFINVPDSPYYWSSTTFPVSGYTDLAMNVYMLDGEVDRENKDNSNNFAWPVRGGVNATLTVVKSGTGQGIVTSEPPAIDCGATCTSQDVTLNYGDVITLTAAADIPYAFTEWMSGCAGRQEDCTLTLVNDVTVTASFNTYTKLTLITPNGGERLHTGDTFNIRWGAPSGIATYRLFYSVNNGVTWTLIDEDITTRSYLWKVPAIKNIGQARVKVTGYNEANKKIASDMSDKPFTIEVVTITSPQNGDMFYSGKNYTLRWTTHATPRDVASVKVFYTINNGLTWKPILATITGNPGQFIWTVPPANKPKAKCKVKVILNDGAGKNLGSVISDGYFTVAP